MKKALDIYRVQYVGKCNLIIYIKHAKFNPFIHISSSFVGKMFTLTWINKANTLSFTCGWGGWMFARHQYQYLELWIYPI